jgi:hypothetical protein
MAIPQRRRTHVSGNTLPGQPGTSGGAIPNSWHETQKIEQIYIHADPEQIIPTWNRVNVYLHPKQQTIKN